MEQYLLIKKSDLVALSGAADPSSGRSEVECLLLNFLESREIPVIDWSPKVAAWIELSSLGMIAEGKLWAGTVWGRQAPEGVGLEKRAPVFSLPPEAQACKR